MVATGFPRLNSRRWFYKVPGRSKVGAWAGILICMWGLWVSRAALLWTPGQRHTLFFCHLPFLSESAGPLSHIAKECSPQVNGNLDGRGSLPLVGLWTVFLCKRCIPFSYNFLGDVHYFQFLNPVIWSQINFKLKFDKIFLISVPLVVTFSEVMSPFPASFPTV